MQADLLIIGAGPAGLCHAFWRLQQDPDLDVRIVDKAPQPGGWVQTRRIEGYSCEIGPQAFRPNDDSDALIAALGMESRVVSCNEAAKLRFIARGGVLHPLPMGPGDLLRSRLFTFGGKLRFVTEPFRKSRSPAGETLAQFTRRRFGKQTVPLAEAMASGVFGGDAHRLEMAAAFSKVLELEAEHGSLMKAMGALARERRAKEQERGQPRPALCTFKTGMEELIQTLRQKLGDRLVLGWKVSRVHHIRDRWTAFLAGDSATTITANELVIAVPAHTTSLLLSDVDADLAAELRAIPFADIADIYLGFWASDVAEKLAGFGFLMDRSENSPYLGAIYASSLFPDRAMKDRFLVRILAGGALNEGFLERDEDTIAQEAEQLLRDYTGITGQLLFKRVYKLRNAIPQYVEGHHDRVDRIEGLSGRHPGLKLIGNSFYDVSLVGQLGK
jgi:protoporphyrinogen/coproporphyrinogen III oxidase